MQSFGTFFSNVVKMCNILLNTLKQLLAFGTALLHCSKTSHEVVEYIQSVTNISNNAVQTFHISPKNSATMLSHVKQFFRSLLPRSNGSKSVLEYIDYVQQC